MVSCTTIYCFVHRSFHTQLFIVGIELNSFKYSHLIVIVLFATVKWFHVLLFIVCTQLDNFKYCYLLFAHS